MCVGGYAELWRIFACDAVSSPFIFGAFRPRIYITSGIDEKTARLIILHEEAHIGRGDHIWKPLGFLILCVYRFDPLIWLVYIIFCMDIEHCLGFKMSFRAKKYAPAAPR